MSNFYIHCLLLINFVIPVVSLSLHLKNIHSFDEVAGVLTLNAYLFIIWYDEFLTWNFTDYDGLDLARWSQVKISGNLLHTYFSKHIIIIVVVINVIVNQSLN